MARVILFAPLRVEASRLRPSFPPDTVVHCGPGPRRANQARHSATVDGPDALAVAGIAGGVSPWLAPGDVVVATEVRGPAGTIACSAAEILAAALRRRGMQVHAGPVASVPHIVVRRRDRDRLGRTGALCVDTESAWLLADAGTRPLACVRVVADAPPDPVVHPATVHKLRAALDRLPAVADVLAQWAAAIRPRTVLLAAPRSFCAGVERAIDIVERALAMRGAPVYVRRQIVHNTHVVRDLAAKGAVFVDDLDDVPPGAAVVFSAHGVSPTVRATADDRLLDVIDATCPLVTKVHSEARRLAARGDTILLIGHHGHEETEGTLGEAPDRTILVESREEATRVQVPDPARVSYLVQTTLAADVVQDVVEVLRERFPSLRDPPSADICYATTNRQDAVRAVGRDADLMLVVGSANSSNSRRLVEVAERAGTPAYLIDDISDIDLRWLSGASTIGMTAGASAPPGLVTEVIEALRGLGPVEVAERTITTEDVHFMLPKEVRSA